MKYQITNFNPVMKFFSIFIISSQLLLSVRAFQCPEKFGHFPDSGDCSQYYVCNHGRSLIQKCDDGLLYNTFLKTCDWPRNVQCDKGGKRVNTRRNPDLQKTSHKRHKSDSEESNQLSPDHNYDDSPSNDGDNYDNDNYRQPSPKRVSATVRPDFPKWNSDFSLNQFTRNPQSRGPVTRSQPSVNNRADIRTSRVTKPTVRPHVEEDDRPTENPHDYDDEYDTPDYYEYETDAPVRNVRKPVKEAEESPPKPVSVEPKPKGRSVKRIGWLPEDPDSNRMNDYHWSPNDAVQYSKDKPKIPNEAYVTMSDFRDVEKKLAEDNTPNEGPEPKDEEEDDDYLDYYEDDEENPHHNHHNEEEEEEEQPHNDEETTEPPEQPVPHEPSKEVTYDDDEDVRQEPRVPPPQPARRPARPKIPAVTQPPIYSNPRPAPPPPAWNRVPAPRAQPFARIQPSSQTTSGPPSRPPSDEISGLRSVANKYESVPKAVSPLRADHLTAKPVRKTNIHYKNNNSPYLRPVSNDVNPTNVRRSDSSKDNSNNGLLINSVPRNDVKPKRKRVVIRRKVIKNSIPKQLVDRSESVTPDIYQLLDEYRSEVPQTLLTHKAKAQEFRDSIIDNYMNINKPDYILNDQDFGGVKSYTVPLVTGEDRDSNNERDFDKDFQTKHEKRVEEKHKKLGSDRNTVNVNKNDFNYNNNIRNESSQSLASDKTGYDYPNTDAIVKQQRQTTARPRDEKVTKKPKTYSDPIPNDFETPAQRTPQQPFGWKQSAVIPTTTTARPTTRSTSAPKIRIKTTRTTAKPKKTTEWYQNINYEPKSSDSALSYTKANKCDPMYCRLPDCRCGGTDIPGGLHPKQTPQIILLTFDDSVNDLNWDIYDELFNSGRNNPNGCPITATFYVSHEWTDYAQVQTLYARGHEIASHSITHSFGEKFSKELWLKEVSGQREILRLYGGVKESDVRGMRAPFLQTGGNTMFEMLYESNFTYDSSLPVYEINPPYFPYTLDYAITHECMIPPCPTKSFPGLWEVGMVMWEDLRDGRCSMADACFNPKDEQGVYEMVKKNFDRHYTTNRSPFGIYVHSRWFLTEHNRKGFIKFMDEINGLNDVYFLTNWQMIQWMRDPQPVDNIRHFKPWQCDHTDRPHECDRPNMCKVRLRSEIRVLKTCQPCPKSYPWRGNNGLKNN